MTEKANFTTIREPRAFLGRKTTTLLAWNSLVWDHSKDLMSLILTEVGRETNQWLDLFLLDGWRTQTSSSESTMFFLAAVGVFLPDSEEAMQDMSPCKIDCMKLYWRQRAFKINYWFCDRRFQYNFKQCHVTNLYYILIPQHFF